MAELDKGKPVSLEELMVSTLAMTDALTKLLIEKASSRRRSSSRSCLRSVRHISGFESHDAITENGYGQASTRQ
jgi:hypothetical protein